MADPKELELKLKATGGDAAAAEVEKLEDAIDGLNDSTGEVGTASGSLAAVQSDLTNRFAEARAKVEALKNASNDLNGSPSSGAGALFPTFAKAGQGVSALGGKLLAMAGGPIGVAIAAVGALVAMFQNLRAAEKANEDALNALQTRFDDASDAATTSADAVGTATTAVRDYKDELGAMTDATNAALDAWEESERRVLALADAQNELKKANIDARVAAGEITAEEGDVMKGELDVAAVKAKADAELKLAEGRKSAADVEAARAADAEQKAAADVAAAKAAAEEEKKKVAKADNEIKTKKLQADIVKDASPEDIVKTLGREETERRLRDTSGIAGGIANLSLDAGAAVEDVIGPFDRAAITKQLADEAKEEADALDEAGKKSVETAEQIVAEREAQLEAVKAAREKADAEAKQSGDAVEKAGFEKTLVDEYKAPAMETRNNTTRAKGEERAAKQKADDEARAAKEEARQSQLAESGAISGDLSRLGRNGAANGFDPAAVKALDSAAAKLSNGTDFSELTSVIGSLTTAADQLDAKNQAAINAALAPIKVQLANLLSRLNNQR